MTVGIAEFQDLPGDISSSQMRFHASIDKDSKATSLTDAVAWLTGEKSPQHKFFITLTVSAQVRACTARRYQYRYLLESVQARNQCLQQLP